MDASKERSLANVAQTLAENARYIADGVKALEKEGAAAVDDAVVRSVLEDHDRRDDRLLHGEAGAEHERHVVVTIEGNDIARKVAQQYNIPKIRTIAEAQASHPLEVCGCPGPEAVWRISVGQTRSNPRLERPEVSLGDRILVRRVGHRQRVPLD